MRHVVLVLSACITACSNAPKPDDRICSTPPKVEPGQWGNCVHKWSYRLAGAPGSNAEIAKAAVNACSDAIAFQINAAPASERADLAKAIMQSAPEEGLFRVIQARAGHCAIPE